MNEEPTRNEPLTVGDTSVSVCEPSPDRQEIVLTNTSAGGQVITICVGYKVCVAGQGIVLQPTAMIAFSKSAGYRMHNGSITAIASAGGGTLAIYER